MIFGVIKFLFVTLVSQLIKMLRSPFESTVRSRQLVYSQLHAEEVEVTSRINRYLDENAFRDIALGENYFRLMGMDKYLAPQICPL